VRRIADEPKMPRKIFKRFMPDQDRIRNHKFLNKIFGKLLHDPNLLHLNRRSIAGAMAVGLFFAFVPLPSQMVLAAGTAIWLRVNLPLSVSMVWLTNPFTIPPIFYFCYQLGTWLMGTPTENLHFEVTWAWLSIAGAEVLEPFLLGCLVMSVLSAILGWSTVRLLWRLRLIQLIKLRRQRKQNLK